MVRVVEMGRAYTSDGFYYPLLISTSVFLPVFHKPKLHTSLVVHRVTTLKRISKVAKDCSFYQVPRFSHFFLQIANEFLTKDKIRAKNSMYL